LLFGFYWRQTLLYNVRVIGANIDAVAPNWH